MLQEMNNHGIHFSEDDSVLILSCNKNAVGIY